MNSWWRRNATVRLQTTLVAVLVTGAALFVGAFAVLRAVRGDIRGRVERQVQDAAGQIARQIASGITLRGSVFTTAVGEGLVPPTITVTDIDTGAVVMNLEPAVVSNEPGTTEQFQGPQVALGLEPPGAIAASKVPSDAIKKTVTVETPYARYRVVAWTPSSVVKKNSAALQNSLTAGFPMLAVLVGLVTWTLTGRSLRPVERIRAEVEEISAHTLDRRVPVPQTEDEIGRLAHTMNRMLDRLESSAQRQREFVSDASHELRSPISAIRSELEVALRDPTRAEWVTVAENSLAENERLEQLVGDLLTLARLDEGRVPVLEEVDLDDVVREEIARLHDQRVRADVVPVRLRGNREQIGRALRNLLENARRFANETIEVDLSRTDGSAVIAVADDGSGIPEADRERVFDRFVRLDEGRARSEGGAGLGLALVRAIVLAHGGSVSTVPSNAGGARIVMRLPETHA